VLGLDKHDKDGSECDGLLRTQGFTVVVVNDSRHVAVVVEPSAAAHYAAGSVSGHFAILYVCVPLDLEYGSVALTSQEPADFVQQPDLSSYEACNCGWRGAKQVLQQLEDSGRSS